MELQKLYSYTRKAIDDYHMISDGDHIALGISGGKDSITLLYALAGLRRFYPRHFKISAFTVDLGFEGFKDGLSGISELCERFSVPYTIISTPIAEIIFSERKEKNPCSLCATLRKGAMNDFATQQGCNKVAFAHHKDDMIDTLLMSLIYEGRIHTFAPNTFLDRTGLTVIRPLMYVPEMDIIGFQHKYELPVVKNPCPMDGVSKREYVNNLTKQLERENPGVKQRIFHAICQSCFDDNGYNEK
ncbi:MAG: tRNA 2-thiocytidine biosynthesis TtcA family protein [Lachnospiraceae bacterium]|nr:tRNA 2-thiocytidine biosynthesis TtcA family protein [Lachnospiraceae bacterium]